MSDHENEQDFTGALIGKIKQFFENRTALIITAAVLVVIAAVIIAVSIISGRQGGSGEELEYPSALADETANEEHETSSETEEPAQTTKSLKYPMIKINSSSPVFNEINNSENPYRLSLEIAAESIAERNLTAAESGYSATVDNESIQGTVVELGYTEGLEVDRVKLIFEIKESARANVLNKYTSESDEFDGIKRFNIFMYDEELNMQLPIETKYDLDNNIVYAETDRCGTYSLVDMEIWFDMLGVGSE